MSCRRLLPFVARQFSTTTQRQTDVVHPGYDKLKANQELFQREDGRPVHIKKGGFDLVLYRFTMFLSVFGVGGCVYAYYKLATGKK